MAADSVVQKFEIEMPENLIKLIDKAFGIVQKAIGEENSKVPDEARLLLTKRSNHDPCRQVSSQ